VKLLAILHQRYRYSAILLKQLVITDFKLRYKGSALGYFWTLLKPLSLFAVMYVIFIKFLRFGGDEPHAAVSLLLGIVLWNYFVEVTTNGMSAIVGRGDLMRKLSFPRYVIVLAGSFSAAINLAINLVIVSIFAMINGVVFGLGALWIIPIFVELFVFSLATAFLLAALYVKLRDVNYIWELLLQVGFYATPIIYSLAYLLKHAPIEVVRVMMLNPLAQIIQDARHSLITDQTMTTWGLFSGSWYGFIPIVFIILFMVLAGTYFRNASPSFAEEV